MTVEAANTPSDNRLSRYLVLALCLHSVLWILLPGFLQPNASLDVVEGFTWGQELQLGYDKHPPLAPWLTYFSSLVLPGSNWPIALLSQLCVVSALIAQYRIARYYVDRPTALLACLLLTLIPYYNYLTPEFNPNVLQLAVWSLTALFAVRAIHSDRLVNWILMGLFAGLAMLTKYYSVVLLVALAAYFFTPRGLPLLRTKGPWIALLVALGTWFPNAIWLLMDDLSAIKYGIARGVGTENSPFNHLSNPLTFFATQCALLLVLLPAYWFCLRWTAINIDSRLHPPGHRTLLNFLVWGPLIITLLISAATGMQPQSMWGTPLFTLLPLWLTVRFGCHLTAQRLRRLRAVWISTSLFFASVYIAEMAVAPLAGKIKKRAHFPGEEMAEQLTDQWQKRFNRPLEYAVASIWIGGNLAFYSADHPSILYDGQPARSPWVNLDKLRKKGGIIVWNESLDGELPAYRELLLNYPQAELQTPIRLDWHGDRNREPVTIGWAVLPPVGNSPR